MTEIRRISITAIASLIAAICLPGTRAAQTNNAPVDNRSFSAFKLVYERNIFNPNRRPGVKDTPRKETPRPARTDRFSLVGTLIHEQGSFAFFDGNDSQYQTVLKQDQKIGGFTLAEITTDKVRLQSGTNAVELAIGMQMKKEEEGAWQAVAASLASSSSTAPSDTKSAATEESTGDAGADAILKRLMEKREKELNK